MTVGGGPTPEKGPTSPERRIGPYEASLRESASQAEATHRARVQAARRRRVVISAVTAVAVAAAGFVSWRLLTPAAPPTSVPSTAASPISCSDATAVTVAAAPAVAPVLAALAETLSTEETGPCAAFTIQSVEPFAVSGTIGTAAAPDAWVTDSTEWVARAGSLAGGQLTVAEPFASTGIVVAMPRAGAEQVGAEAKWASALTAGTPVRVPDPTRSAAGAWALGAAAAGLPADRLTEVIRASAASPAPGLAAVADSQTPLGVVVSAAQLLAFNESNGGRALAAVAPVDGAPSLNYRLITVTDEPKVAGLIADLAAYLGTEDAKSALSTAGFTTPGGPDPELPSPLYGQVVEASAPDAQALKTVRSTWAAASPKRQTLLVLDVSGSMLRRTDQGTRLEVMQAAALESVASLPPTNRVGLWAYSLHIGNKGDDFRQLLGAAPIGDTGHLRDVRKQMAGLTRVVGGGRGLYDTIVASYQRARSTYAPGQQNTVVVIADGPNDDDYGASLADARAKLKRLVDARNPIRLEIIGFGSEPKAEALESFATMTGGRYRSAAKPGDLLPALRAALGG